MPITKMSTYNLGLKFSSHKIITLKGQCHKICYPYFLVKTLYLGPLCRVGHRFFSKECFILTFISILCKRTFRSLRSFPFFRKERKWTHRSFRFHKSPKTWKKEHKRTLHSKKERKRTMRNPALMIYFDFTETFLKNKCPRITVIRGHDVRVQL